MIDWNEKIINWRQEFGCRTLPPVASRLLDGAMDSLQLPDELADFFRSSNGLSSEWFKVFPIYDKSDPKRTWDSLEAVNSSKSRFFGGDLEFMKRFLVFADIGGGRCAAFDRLDGTIWFEEDELHQTNLSLEEFIETSLREVRDL